MKFKMVLRIFPNIPRSPRDYASVYDYAAAGSRWPASRMGFVISAENEAMAWDRATRIALDEMEAFTKYLCQHSHIYVDLFDEGGNRSINSAVLNWIGNPLLGATTPVI